MLAVTRHSMKVSNWQWWNKNGAQKTCSMQQICCSSITP